jgi:transcriptional regulator with XRE-family HTH domain
MLFCSHVATIWSLSERSSVTITGTQIRAARAALGWNTHDLAREAKVGFRTVSRMEQQSDVPNALPATLQAVKRALEAAGIEFVGTPSHGPGIRLHAIKY